MRIPIPERLDVTAALRFGHQLHDLQKNAASGDCFIIDAKELKWVEPFSMLYVANAVSLLRGKCHVEVTEGSLDYAHFIGFFNALSDDGAKLESLDDDLISMRKRTVRYLPICRVGLSQSLYDKIDTCAEKLANVFAGGADGNNQAKWFFWYTFREILRNVYEHSEGREFHICGQYWPQSSVAEVAIIDDGIGIKASLGYNPLYKDLSNFEAVEKACEKGVSGRKFDNSTRDKYQNAGLGLYRLKLLGTRPQSRFVVCSDKSALMFDGNETSRNFDALIEGTAVGLRVAISDTESLQSFLESKSNTA